MSERKDFSEHVLVCIESLPADIYHLMSGYERRISSLLASQQTCAQSVYWVSLYFSEQEEFNILL